jgi:sulfite reductase alpha subunit-like flavoprotein
LIKFLIISGNLDNFHFQENTRTTSEDHFQDVRFISFAKGNLNWNIGDVVYIRPQNLEENVKKLFDILEDHQLGIHSETWIELEEIDSGKYFPL